MVILSHVTRTRTLTKTEVLILMQLAETSYDEFIMGCYFCERGYRYPARLRLWSHLHYFRSLDLKLLFQS